MDKKDNTRKTVIFTIATAIMLLACTGCFNIVSTVESAPSAVIVPVEPLSIYDTLPDDPNNMVDERFELLSLVFRLAGSEAYRDDFTEYQQKLVSEFDGFTEHKAVKYAAKLPLGYDAVFRYSVHIYKQGGSFVLIDDIESLVDDGRWTKKSAAEFLTLLNEFYSDSNFAAFYQSNLEFYKAETERFVEDAYSEIDLDWFGAYVNPNNLRCVYTPSGSTNNYAAVVNDTIVYCAVCGNGSVIVHEYCHSFANPIAHKWYEENAEFKKICDDTIDPQRLPTYPGGKTIAGEYVVRAYNTLYYAEHGYAVQSLLYAEKGQGFPYIEDVYAMITPYNKLELGDDPIRAVLGVGYKLGEEQTFTSGDLNIKWHVLSLDGPLPYEFYPTEVGNVFESNTGDVLRVENDNEDDPYLLVDLGETTFHGMDGFRSYSRIPLE